MYRWARAARIYDGPDEVHRQTVARQTLKDYTASEVPTEYIPTRAAAAREKFAEALELLDRGRVDARSAARRAEHRRPRVEADGGLERRGAAQHEQVGVLGADELEADGQASRR